MVHSFPTRRSSDLSPWQRPSAVRLPSLGCPSPTSITSGVGSEEHTSELQSHHPNSYAVYCLKKKNGDSDGEIRRMAQAFREPSEHSDLPRPLEFAQLSSVFFFNDTATTEIYTGWYTLSLHDALPISV